MTGRAEQALALCSANLWGRPAERLKLIGVTGTNGKTTVTHLIKQILEGRGHSCGLIGTNHILVGERELESGNTTPEAFRLHEIFREMADAGCEYGIMEVSSTPSSGGRTAEICVGASPTSPRIIWISTERWKTTPPRSRFLSELR